MRPRIGNADFPILAGHSDITYKYTLAVQLKLKLLPPNVNSKPFCLSER